MERESGEREKRGEMCKKSKIECEEGKKMEMWGN
jgi:hypothetical protein